MRISRLALVLAAAAPLLATQARAQGQAPAPASPAPAAAADPVVAKVGGEEVRLSDLAALERTLPEQMRGLPQAQLYPMLLDQMIDRQALVLLARKDGLDKNPEVARAMQRAADQALQNALIARDVGPLVSETALKALYDKEIAGKPGEEEVHARHILVPTEVEAKQVIAELKKGADFAALAKKHSTDPGAAQGGDLGFFKRGEMVPEFADAAFALKPGEVSPVPVHTQYGWHVIKVEERRTAPTPTFEEARAELRQQAIQQGVQAELAAARHGLAIERFNADGSPIRATDTAQPPPAKP